MPEAEELSVFKVIQILFIHKGFFFKGNIEVAFREELNEVPDIKGNNEQFQLLPQMNSLVIDKTLLIKVDL